MARDLFIGQLNASFVATDGKEIKLEVVDRDGGLINVVATPEQAASLLMTLPQLLAASLRARFRDDSLRLVYPLAQYKVERSSDGVNVILSLKTPDGFIISFSMGPELSKPLAGVLGGHEPAKVEPRSFN